MLFPRRLPVIAATTAMIAALALSPASPALAAGESIDWDNPRDASRAHSSAIRSAWREMRLYILQRPSPPPGAVDPRTTPSPIFWDDPGDVPAPAAAGMPASWAGWQADWTTRGLGVRYCQDTLLVYAVDEILRGADQRTVQTEGRLQWITPGRAEGMPQHGRPGVNLPVCMSGLPNGRVGLADSVLDPFAQTNTNTRLDYEESTVACIAPEIGGGLTYRRGIPVELDARDGREIFPRRWERPGDSHRCQRRAGLPAKAQCVPSNSPNAENWELIVDDCYEPLGPPTGTPSDPPDWLWDNRPCDSGDPDMTAGLTVATWCSQHSWLNCGTATCGGPAGLAPGTCIASANCPPSHPTRDPDPSLPAVTWKESFWECRYLDKRDGAGWRDTAGRRRSATATTHEWRQTCYRRENEACPAPWDGGLLYYRRYGDGRRSHDDVTQCWQLIDDGCPSGHSGSANHRLWGDGRTSHYTDTCAFIPVWVDEDGDGQSDGVDSDGDGQADSDGGGGTPGAPGSPGSIGGIGGVDGGVTGGHTPGQSNPGGDGGDGGDSCFLTTAVVGMRGEADDGPTLTAMRQLRDTFMQLTPERRAMVADYYKVAPAIVAAIPKGHGDWQWLEEQVDASAAAFRRGEQEASFEIMAGAVRRLYYRWVADGSDATGG